MNHATQPPAVQAIDLTGFCVTRPETAEEADRIGYVQGYRGMESPSPYDDSIGVATFRARCVGWVRGSNDRIDGKPSQFAEEEYRPSVEPPRISTIMDAEWAGFSLGANGHAVVGPATYGPEEHAAFMRGHEAGFRAYEEAEMDRWQPESSGPSEIHHSELVEGAGVDFARMP